MRRLEQKQSIPCFVQFLFLINNPIQKSSQILSICAQFSTLEINMNYGYSTLTQKSTEEEIELPPGFRFHPTDEELINHYLSKKVLNSNFDAKAIAEIDLNKCEPWDLPKKAKHGEKEWYFFCVRDRKYPTGIRTNRATDAGYWKATGKDKEIRREKLLVGMKKTLVFYIGRAPKGTKTDWIMHEYRLEGNFALNEWVICRVFKKSSAGGENRAFGMTKIASFSSSFEEEMVSGPTLPPLVDAHVSCFSNSLFQAAPFNPSSSFYTAAGCKGGGFDGFTATAVSISQETRLSTAMNTDISSDNEFGRNSFEGCLWNC